MGGGELIYLHIGEYLRAMSSAEEPYGWCFLQGLKILAEAIGLGGGELSRKIRFLGYLRESASFKGDVELEAWSLLAEDLPADEVIIEPGGVSLENTSFNLLRLEGNTSISIKAPELLLKPQSMLPCSYVEAYFPKGLELELDVHEGSALVSVGGSTAEVEKGLRLISSRPTSLRLRGLVVRAEGEIYFGKLWYVGGVGGVIMTVKGRPTEISGTVELEPRASDAGYILLEDLKVGGYVRVLTEAHIPALPVLEVRWIPLLLSLDHLVVLGLVYVLLLWLLRRGGKSGGKSNKPVGGVLEGAGSNAEG